MEHQVVKGHLVPLKFDPLQPGSLIFDQTWKNLWLVLEKRTTSVLMHRFDDGMWGVMYRIAGSYEGMWEVL